MDPTLATNTSGSINTESAAGACDVPGCCQRTIAAHARHNPMMVCTECKQIIKCFQDERAFTNYLTFCKSRRRPVLKGRVEGLYTVVFRSYETSPVYGNR